jgi:hypothetical protein
MQDDMYHRQELIKIKRKNLQNLEKKAAQHSPLEVPLHLLREIDTLKEEIAKLEQEIDGRLPQEGFGRPEARICFKRGSLPC